MSVPLDTARIQAALFIGVLLLCTDACAGKRVIDADQIVVNMDSSKTFIRPRILGEAGRLGIRQGIPGACRLFGMEGYLKDYVVWSADLKNAVPVSDDGTIGDVEAAHYVESMTCTSRQAYFPKITVESIEKNGDGSVTVRLPQIHHGTGQFPVLSGHTAVCRMLGYDKAVKYSLEWSSQRVAGVNLALDGRIYEKASGTYLTALGCKNGASAAKQTSWE